MVNHDHGAEAWMIIEKILTANDHASVRAMTTIGPARE
jgi:hypothetical protein